jgi:hypothetical protein
MPWRDVIYIARPVLYLRAVIQPNPKPSGNLVTDVVHLTTIGMRDRFDAFSPSPTWVKGRSHHSQLAQLDHIDAGIGYCLYLVRRVKVLLYCRCHLTPPDKQLIAVLKDYNPAKP